MTTIYLGKPSSQGWISFENNPHLLRTRQGIYTRCAPCLENLLEQLQEGRKEIALGQAWECWKVVAVLPSQESCWQVLQHLEEIWQGGEMRGKLGRPGLPTWAVILHADNEAERDAWLPLLKQGAVQACREASVFISRACGNPYQEILGPWQDWPGRNVPLLYPQNAPAMIKALHRSLYGDAFGGRG